MLSSYKKPDGSLGVDGIFCPNESTAFAMLRVLQDNGWAGKVRFVGFDSAENLVKGLKSGHIDGLVLQDPVRMGYLGVKTMVAHLKGEPVEKRVDTGVHLATRDNMDTPEMKELLQPDLSKWLKTSKHHRHRPALRDAGHLQELRRHARARRGRARGTAGEVVALVGQTAPARARS